MKNLIFVLDILRIFVIPFGVPFFILFIFLISPGERQIILNLFFLVKKELVFMSSIYVSIVGILYHFIGKTIFEMSAQGKKISLKMEGK